MITLLLACAGKSDDTGLDAGSAWGTITADRAGEAAAMSKGAAFGFDSPTNGKLVFYTAANPNLGCVEVAVALGGPEDPNWDRAALLPAETCALFAYVEYDASSGGSWTEADTLSATLSVACAMDPGSWELSEDCLGSYCYTGHYWQGNPTDFTFAVTGGAGEDYAVDIEMDGYDGHFTYETIDPAPATGRVAGGTAAAWCADIGQTSWFQQ